MNLVRKLKISKVIPVKFTELENKFIDLLNDKLDGLICINMDDYIGYEFFINKKFEFIMYIKTIQRVVIFTKPIKDFMSFNILTENDLKEYIKYFFKCSGKINFFDDNYYEDIIFDTGDYEYEDVTTKLKNKYLTELEKIDKSDNYYKI